MGYTTIVPYAAFVLLPCAFLVSIFSFWGSVLRTYVRTSQFRQLLKNSLQISEHVTTIASSRNRMLFKFFKKIQTFVVCFFSIVWRWMLKIKADAYFKQTRHIWKCSKPVSLDFFDMEKCNWVEHLQDILKKYLTYDHELRNVYVAILSNFHFCKMLLR